MIVGMGIVLGVLFGLMLLAVVAVVMNVCRYLLNCMLTNLRKFKVKLLKCLIIIHSVWNSLKNKQSE